MGRIYYLNVYGFRTEKVRELVHALSERTGLHFEDRETGAYNGVYYLARDRDQCEIMAFRHFEREGGEGWFEPEWRDFAVIVRLEANRPIKYDDAVRSLAAFTPTLLKIWQYDEDAGKQLDHQSWNRRTRNLEKVAPLEEWPAGPNAERKE